MSCQNGAGGQVYRYNGKEFEEEISVYEYGFRYYDPSIGRLTGVDPIADKFVDVSPFNYAENEPISHIDLHGLQAVKFDFGGVNDPAFRHLQDQSNFKANYKRHKAGFDEGATRGLVGGLSIIGLGGLAVEATPATILYFGSNSTAASNVGGFIWGLGTDQDVPGLLGDDFSRVGRNYVERLSNAEAAAIRGGSLWVARFGSIANAGSKLVYIGSKEGIPYIGKTATTITARYKDYRKAPLPITDYFNAPENQLLNIEAALIQFNGGAKSSNISNINSSSGNPAKGEEWLNTNISNWKTRFDFRKD